MTLLTGTLLSSTETLLVSIPESAGLLTFGVALVVLAVVLRNALSRRPVQEVDEDIAAMLETRGKKR